MNYVDFNASAWDAIASPGKEDGRTCFTLPISHEDYLQAQKGALEVSLTSAKKVPVDWFPPLRGQKILGLASGGGQQGPVFAAHGADVTIVDISEKQLESERAVADREGYPITILKCNMQEPLPFADHRCV